MRRPSELIFTLLSAASCTAAVTQEVYSTQSTHDAESAKGLGDPIGVKQHSRPSASGAHKWVEEFGTDPSKKSFMEGVIAQLDSADLETLGYPLAELWKPLEDAEGKTFVPKKQTLSAYRLQRKAIVKLRGAAQRSGLIRKGLRKVRLVCDVLLRE